MAKSPLMQGRELKCRARAGLQDPRVSPLMQGRELKLVICMPPDGFVESPLMQGRELKYSMSANGSVNLVAPHAGA